MNKKLIIWSVVVFVVISFGGVLFLNNKNKNAPVLTTYYCQEGVIKVQYGKNYVVVNFNDGQNILLPQTISGSGIRYELGTTTFWSKGDNAFITEGTTTTYTNCVSGIEKRIDQTTISYTDTSKTFTFSYPNQFILSGGNIGYSQDWAAGTSDLGLLLAVVDIPRSIFTKTNFGDAKFKVGMSVDPNAIKNCLTYNYGNIGTTSEVTIGKTKFTKINFTDVGAGNYYETTSYRTIHNDQCYAVEYTIHSSNIYNYSPDQGIKEFDKVKITSILEGMAQSFKFI